MGSSGGTEHAKMVINEYGIFKIEVAGSTRFDIRTNGWIHTFALSRDDATHRTAVECDTSQMTYCSAGDYIAKIDAISGVVNSPLATTTCAVGGGSCTHWVGAAGSASAEQSITVNNTVAETGSVVVGSIATNCQSGNLMLKSIVPASGSGTSTPDRVTITVVNLGASACDGPYSVAFAT